MFNGERLRIGVDAGDIVCLFGIQQCDGHSYQWYLEAQIDSYSSYARRWEEHGHLSAFVSVEFTALVFRFMFFQLARYHVLLYLPFIRFSWKFLGSAFVQKAQNLRRNHPEVKPRWDNGRRRRQ